MLISLLLLSQLITSVYATDRPYFITFKHHSFDVLQCSAAFTKVRDAVFADYVKDLIATTNFTKSMADSIDSTWATVGGNITATIPVATTTVVTTVTRTVTNTRQLGCGNGVCGDLLSIIIQRGCCDACNKNCRRRNLLRQLQTTADPILDIEVLRSNTTGYIIVDNEGDQLSSDTTGLPGAKVAAEFYNYVKLLIPISDPCNAILLGTKYKVMEMKIVKH
jgi:hypothetical protein